MSEKRSDGLLAEPQASPHYWHLAEDDIGVAMTDMEYAMIRTFEAFARWQTECLAAVSGHVISGQENVLLHIIGMHGRPKTIRDLLHLTNRQDIANVQYGLRKLLKLHFIEKEGSGRVGVFYRATPAGDKVCRDYARLRQKLLLAGAERFGQFVEDAEKCQTMLEKAEKLYETCAREAATFYRR